MANAIFGYNNLIETGTLAASTEVSGLPISNLKTPQGASSTSWQTPSGYNSGWFTLNAGSNETWQAFLLARTNLTSSAQVRWRVGSTVEAVKEETPFFDIDFTATSPTYPAGWAFASRGSVTGVSTYWDSTGTLQVATNTAPRITYDPVTRLLKGCLLEPTRTNLIRNPRLEGVVVGALNNTANTGTAPTFWTVNVGTGLFRNIVAVGTENGIPYMDVRVYGTPSSTPNGFLAVYADSLALTNGVKYTTSYFSRVLPGGTNNPNGTISFLGTANNTAVPALTTAALNAQRGSGLITANATGAQNQCNTYYFSAAFTNVTIRIGAVQTEVGEFATMPMFPASGTPAASTRSFDYAAYAMAGWVQGAATVATEWSEEKTGMTTVSDYANFGVGTADLTSRLLNRFVAGVFNSPSSSWVSYADSSEASATAFVNTAPTAHLVPNTVYRLSAAADSTSFYTAHDGVALSLSTGTGGGTLPTNFDTVWLFGGNGGIAYMRKLRVYNKRLTNNQVRSLTAPSGVWSTLDTYSTTFDSGYISGVKSGYGQILHYSGTPITGQYARCDIMDILNTDNHISVGLAYAGAVWQPGINMGWESVTNTTATIDEVTTRGGQQYPQYRYEQRHWDITLDNIAIADLWTKAMEFYRSFRRGGNVLFCPDPTSGDMQRETVFGRGESLADIGYVAQQTDYRSWRVRVTERL